MYSNPGFVYIIRCESGHYKIGKTKGSVAARFSALQTGSPLELTLIHTIQCHDCGEAERFYHAHFASKRVRGEWFALEWWEIASLKTITEISAEYEIPAPTTWEQVCEQATADADCYLAMHEDLQPLWGPL